MKNYEEERKEIGKFIELFNESLLVDLEYTDKPDALFNSKKNGIEHTRLYQPKLDEENSVQHQEVLLDEIVAKSKSIFSSKTNNTNIDVHLSFETNYWINIPQERFSRNDIEGLSNEISFFVYDNLPSKGNTLEFDILETNILPKGITSLTIHHSITNTVCDWSRVKGGIIPLIDERYIQKIITTKNNKYHQYQKKCQKCWLLIVSNYVYERNIKIEDNCLHNTYESKFDRIFLLFIKLAGADDFYELKISLS